MCRGWGGKREGSKPKPACPWGHWLWLRGISWLLGPSFCSQAVAAQGKLSRCARTLDVEQHTTASPLGADSRATTWGQKKAPSEFRTSSSKEEDREGGLGDQERKMWPVGHHVPCGMGTISGSPEPEVSLGLLRPGSGLPGGPAPLG